MNDCAILILSCDKNDDVLNIFINFFYKNWSNCTMPVYIGLEKKMDFKKCIVLNSNKKKWSERIKEYILKIPQNYVLILLDDFIIESPVDENIILSYHAIMINNPQIANITLTHIPDKKNENSFYDTLIKRNKNGKYLLNMQCGIWKKDILYALLKEKESPWEAELYGSIRARKYVDYTFLCLNKWAVKPISYNGGWLIVRGVWNGSEIKRLNLSENKEITSGNRRIEYTDFDRISFTDRVIRRLKIMLRQFLSKFQFYI